MDCVFVVVVQLEADRADRWPGEQVKAGAFTSGLPSDIDVPNSHVCIKLASAHSEEYVFFYHQHTPSSILVASSLKWTY